MYHGYTALLHFTLYDISVCNNMLLYVSIDLTGLHTLLYISIPCMRHFVLYVVQYGVVIYTLVYITNVY